jgi:hypothetical protein
MALVQDEIDIWPLRLRQSVLRDLGGQRRGSEDRDPLRVVLRDVEINFFEKAPAHRPDTVMRRLRASVEPLTRASHLGVGHRYLAAELDHGYALEGFFGRIVTVDKSNAAAIVNQSMPRRAEGRTERRQAVIADDADVTFHYASPTSCVTGFLTE